MIFETIMLVCFGIAWPFSIYKSWKSREVGSKSFIFLLALFIGYIAGILHKIFFAPDAVIVLYVLNAVMVATDIGLYLRNRLYHIRRSAEQARGTEGPAGTGQSEATLGEPPASGSGPRFGGGDGPRCEPSGSEEGGAK